MDAGLTNAVEGRIISLSKSEATQTLDLFFFLGHAYQETNLGSYMKLAQQEFIHFGDKFEPVWIDIGCGRGLGVIRRAMLTSIKAIRLGVDLSSEMIRTANSMLEACGESYTHKVIHVLAHTLSINVTTYQTFAGCFRDCQCYCDSEFRRRSSRVYVLWWKNPE